MNTLHHLFSVELIEALGWSIVHSLWQATAVALVLALLIFLLRHKSAQIKYFISFVALLGILGWSSVTFIQSYHYAVEKQLVKEKMLTDRAYLKALLKEKSSRETIDAVPGEYKPNLGLIKTRAFFQRNFNLICSIWLIGMVLLMFRFVGGLLYTRRLRSYQIVPLSEEWLSVIESLIVKLGIKRKVLAFSSPLASVPMTLGTLKPIILFPITAFTGLSSKEIEAIIAHELAHVMRNDYLFNIIQSMVEILFFYHPAVWMISSQIRAERENSCDNIAIETTGDKIAYVKALAAVQIQQSTYEQQLSMAFSSKKQSVLQRIKRLQKQVVMKTNFIEGLIAAGVIVVGLALASFTLGSRVFTQMPKEEKQETVVPLPKAKSDSIRTEFEALIKNMDSEKEESKEIEQVAEVAYSEGDTETISAMMKELDQAMKDLNIEQIVQDAMREASAAMREAAIEVHQAQNDIDRHEIQRDMDEARRDIAEARREVEEDMRRDMQADGIDQATIDVAVKAASAGLDIAASVVGSIDVEAIVSSALNGVSAALGSMGNIEFDSVPSANQRSKEELKAQMKEIEKAQKQLEKEQAKLKKQMKKLDEQE